MVEKEPAGAAVAPLNKIERHGPRARFPIFFLDNGQTAEAPGVARMKRGLPTLSVKGTGRAGRPHAHVTNL